MTTVTAATIDHPQLVEDAATVVETLAAAVHAYMLDDDDRVEVLLGQLTPPELLALAARLRQARFELELDRWRR